MRISILKGFFPIDAARLAFYGLICALVGPVAIADGADRPSVSLDGSWEFRFAPDDRGIAEHWYSGETAYDRKLEVPGCWDAQGVGEPTDKMRHNAIGIGWYRRSFTIPGGKPGQNVWLVIGGVHRTAKVWLNEQFLGEHIGYPVAFRFDITEKLKAGPQSVVIAVDSRQDRNRDPLAGTFDVIDYMDLAWGGIYEHISVETTGEAWIDDAFVQPDPEAHKAELDLSFAGAVAGASISYRVCPASGMLTLAEGEMTASGKQARLTLDLPNAPWWTPATPSLLTLELTLRRNGQILDTRSIRFGLRKLDARNRRLSLNGAPFFLRGYGEDFVFPRELLPPARVDFWKSYLQKRKDLGFNAARHHSAMPVESYLQAADEMGMLVQPELPIAYLHFLLRAKPEGMETYKQVWRDYIRQMRNHPSVMSWCVDNEIWRGIPLAEELYKIAKDLDNTRLVIDCDGIPQPSLPARLATNSSTLDYYSVAFREHDLPWGKYLGKYRIKDLPRPVVAHEMANWLCLPDPAEARGFDGVIKPFWLDEMNHAVKEQGLEELLPQMLQASWRLKASMTKLNIEAARLAGLDGYWFWLFRDYWTQSSGLESMLGNTREMNPTIAREFNADAVLLWDREQVSYSAAEKIPLSLFVSDFRPAGAPPINKVTVRLGENTTELQAPPSPGNRGTIGPWTGEIMAPEIRAPQRFVVVAEAGELHNEWPVWIWPPAPPPGKTVLVTPMLTKELLKKLEEGANVLVTDERLAFPTQEAPFNQALWKGDEKREWHYGNLFLQHAALSGFPHDGYGDLQAYELLNHRPVTNLSQVPGHIEPIVWALDLPQTMRRMAYLWEARVGRGRLLVSAFALDHRQRETSLAAKWMHALLTRYASSSDFQPKSELPIEWLQAKVSAPGLPDLANCVEGFHAMVASSADNIPGNTYRENYVRSYLIRQSDGARRLTWKTAPVPGHWQSENITFVWAGGMDSTEPPESGDAFTLTMNGSKLCDIQLVNKSFEWPCALGSTLSYQMSRATPEATFGLFCLTIPSNHLTPGRPIELTLTGAAQNSQHWVSIAPYRDVIKTLRDE